MYTAYSSPKTALNAITVDYAADLKDTPTKVNNVCPDRILITVPQPSTTSKVLSNPSDGAKLAVTMATLPFDGATGGFFNDDGTVAW